jgi:nucleoside-diphosphate-sugar epimerase
LALATGEWLLFLNPDCLVRPETLTAMIDELSRRPSAGMAGCLIRNTDGSADPACARLLPTPGRLFRQWIGIAAHDSMADAPEAISGAFMLVRRSALAQVGSFDAGYFMHWEDLDLCLRFRNAGFGILYVPHVEVMHARGRSSRRRPYRVEWWKHAGMLRYLGKHYLQRWRLPLLLPLSLLVVARYLARIVRLAPPSTPTLPAQWTEDGRSEIWVFGATSIVGRTLLPRLLAAGYRVRAFCSNPIAHGQADSPHLTWHALDLNRSDRLPAGRPQALIHLAPLTLLPPWVSQLAAAGVRRVVAFGTTSRYTKLTSTDPDERQLARDFADSETMVADACAASGVQWAILRPTMIYCLGHDGNVSKLAGLIRRFGFFLLPGRGSGKRQPVHADDLAKACLQIFARPDAWNRSYDLSGGEVLSYRAMVEAIFRKLNRPARIVSVPRFIWRPALSVLRIWPGYRPFNAQMARRVDVDMCFDHRDATEAFGFAPRPFLP